MPVYSRADISRTMGIVVAPFPTADATCALAREFRVADTRREAYPAVEALRHVCRLVVARIGGRHRIQVFDSRQFGEENEATTAERGSAAAGLIERNCKVE